MEDLEVSFLPIVEQAAVESQSARFGAVGKGCRVVGAHLEKDAEFTFLLGLP